MKGDLPQATLYEFVGGEDWFVDLVDRFYEGVSGDELLRPLYPEDLTESRAHMSGFLVQYWGGPATYSEQRGHPRLRMRHMPFAIGEAEKDAWLHHMSAAVREKGLDPEIEAHVLEYFDNAANHLLNQ